jgi:hypothetical protein
VKESRVDAERLAALLDGRLGERERAEVLAELAASDEAYEAYADALAVARELEGERGASAVIPLDPRRARWRRGGSRGLWVALAAAGLVGIAVLPWLRSDRDAADSPTGVVAILTDRTLPASWDGAPWATTRGAGDPRSDAARAARLGARLVDFELAARAHDPRARALAGDVARLLDGVPRGPIVATLYRAVSSGAVDPRDSLALLLERGRAAARGASESHYTLGAWAEAGRVAAAHGDGGYFKALARGDALSAALGSSDVSPEARALVERVRAAAASSGAPDLGAVRRDLDELLAVLGG